MCVVFIEKEKERRTRVRVTGQREKRGSGLTHPQSLPTIQRELQERILREKP